MKGREINDDSSGKSWWRLPVDESHLGAHECHLGECQHVEVGHVVFVSALDPLLALLRVDHLPHVLGHKVALEENNKLTVQNFEPRFSLISSDKKFPSLFHDLSQE